MQCLRINNGKGEFSLNGTTFSALDEIKKEDILRMLEIALDENQSFEMDEYSADSITNPAHKVIYHNLYEKFEELGLNKAMFVDEVKELYKDAYDKYKLIETSHSSSPDSYSSET